MTAVRLAGMTVVKRDGRRVAQMVVPTAAYWVVLKVDPMAVGKAA